MRIKTSYIAKDGREFYTAEKCCQYERELDTMKLTEAVRLFDVNGELMEFSKNNLLSTWCMFISIPDKEILQLLQDTIYCDDDDVPPSNIGLLALYNDNWIPAKDIIDLADTLKKIIQNYGEV